METNGARKKWYLASGESWIGPMTAEDILERVSLKQITLAHFIWCTGQTDWKRICEVAEFQAVLPTAPNRAGKPKEVSDSPVLRVGRLGPPTPPESSEFDDREWFLFYNEAQFGPFSSDEVRRFLVVGKINPRVYAWSEGMKDWERLAKITDFADQIDDFATSASVTSAAPGVTHAAALAPTPTYRAPRIERRQERRVEKRIGPRRVLSARVLMANDEEQSVLSAATSDISLGGMQVMAERVPGRIGSRIKLNVTPSSGRTGLSLKPFVAEGTIVRVAEDGRGFSFRFDRLKSEARQAIEEYIES